MKIYLEIIARNSEELKAEILDALSHIESGKDSYALYKSHGWEEVDLSGFSFRVAQFPEA